MTTMTCKPTAFGDMRGWMKALDAAGELHNVDAEVDWKVELGTVARLAQGPAPARRCCSTISSDYGENAAAIRSLPAGCPARGASP